MVFSQVFLAPMQRYLKLTNPTDHSGLNERLSGVLIKQAYTKIIWFLSKQKFVFQSIQRLIGIGEGPRIQLNLLTISKENIYLKTNLLLFWVRNQ